MGKIGLYEESTSIIITGYLSNIFKHLALGFMGTLMFFLSYLCLSFYKEFVICYLRRNEKFIGVSFYRKFLEYKQHLNKIILFNFVLFLFWSVIIFLNKPFRKYIILTGFVIFSLGYVVSMFIHYKYYYYKKDYFEQLKWCFNYVKNLFKKNISEKEKIN